MPSLIPGRGKGRNPNRNTNMKLEKRSLKNIIRLAKKAFACDYEINKLSQFSSMEELLEKSSDQDKAFWAEWYAGVVMKKRWPEAEEIILKNMSSAYNYALHIMKERWTQAEAIFLTRADYSAAYAVNLMKERWPEAEAIIASDACEAVWYARNMIKERWPEAEETISKDFYWRRRYEDLFNCTIGSPSR